MALTLALDQGTTSSRAIVFDLNGTPKTSAQADLRQIYPEPSWVEHDAREILATQLACASKALDQLGSKKSEVQCIGIANQRETAVIWDRKTGVPIHHAIVWQDRRTAAWCDAQVEAGNLPLVKESTGLVLDPYFSAGKVVWLLDHVEGARARAERGELAFGNIDSWLIWNMTGGLHVTDVSNASRTLLFNIHKHCWDERLLEAFDIPVRLLPEVRPSSGDFGATRADLFGRAIAIGGVAGDQQAALFGQGCVASGQVKNTYGTGCFMLMHTGDTARASKHGLVTTCTAQADGTHGYAIEGSVFSAGSAVQWLRDELHIIDTAADIEALAASVPDSGGVVLVPAFTGLGSPHWDAYARGGIFGLTRGTNRAHIARAALDAIALQSSELLLAMHTDSGLEVAELRVDGGAAGNDLLMQLQADLLGIPVIRPEVGETTAQGAADLAALSAGLWHDVESLHEARRAVAHETRFEPRMSRDWAHSQMDAWRAAVARILTK
jgi:glycerol kinase